MKRILIGILTFSIAATVIFTFSCTGENAIIKAKPSTFCANIPDGTQSVICYITDKIGTTPEAIGMGLQLADLAGADQWYQAQQADEFLKDLQTDVGLLRGRLATWEDLAVVLLSRYDVLPAKAQSALIMAKDVIEFKDDFVSNAILPDYDWDRIDMRLKSLREMLLPYLVEK